MARARTKTLLSLDKFAEILGINPLHFNQVVLPGQDPAVCGMPMYQYSWQRANALGREEIAMAIANAEHKIAQYLGFSPFPTWFYETHTRHSPNPPVQNNYYILKTGQIICPGIERKQKLECASITYEDRDNDGYKELAWVNISADYEPFKHELAIYYPNKNGEDIWEIRPIQILDKIYFRREQCVLHNYYEEINPRGVNGEIDSNFLDRVDIYRHYTDTSKQAEVDGVDCTVNVVDSRLGVVDVNSNHSFKTRIYYYAGWPGEDDIWSRAVTYYAASLLDSTLCDCRPLDVIINYWQEDLSLRTSSPTGAHSYQRSLKAFDCPLGTTRAAEYVWRLIQMHKIGG